MAADIGPAEAVREFLEAESRFESTTRSTAGPFRELVAIVEQVNASVAATTNHSAVNIRSSVIRERDGERAVVDLDAFVVLDFASEHARGTNDFRYRGPVELVRDDDGWKITSAVVDGVPMPGAVYEPVLRERVGACDVTMFALPSKRGVNVFARVVNDSDRPVTVSELQLAVPYLRFLRFRWGSVLVPALVAPHDSWAGVVGWTPLPLRKSIRATIRIDREELEIAFEPTLTRHRSLPHRARRVDRTNVLLGSVAVLGALVAVLVGDLSLLGITLAVWGPITFGRAVVVELAHFRSSASIVLGAAGATMTVAGSALLLSAGFGWFPLVLVVGTMLFAMQRGAQMARYIHRQRSRHVETG